MRLKHGKDTGRLGTTCLRRHMSSCHASRWRKTLRRSSSSVSTPTVCPAMSLPTTSTYRDDATVMDVPGPSSQCDSIPSAEDLRSQITLPQLLQRKKKYSPNHPQAQRLNASLAKLLALQLLPFQLVDSAPFREFAECAVPQWQVPKCHYFSRKVIPALYQHMEDNVIESLGKAVSSKVHVTLDTWSSKHGQGRYISFTAHWVTLIAAGRDPRGGSVLELVHPPRLQKAACMRFVCSTTTSPSSSSFCVSGEVAVKPTPDRGYAMAQAKRCDTVLELVCLGDRSHTGPEILSALQGQVQRWLTPRQLQLGMVVCDNGSNLLSTLRLGKLTHVPCLAHILNLVVQHFLTRYPGLAELLSQARKVCSHFRRSFPPSVRLAEIQREFHLPTIFGCTDTCATFISFKFFEKQGPTLHSSTIPQRGYCMMALAGLAPKAQYLGALTPLPDSYIFNIGPHGPPLHSSTIPQILIFQDSFLSGIVPEDWRKADVVPIFKKGLKFVPGNYRPVSLTSVAGKVFEGLLRDNIQEFIGRYNVIGKNQHGFMKHRSCQTNLITFYEEVSRSIDQGVAVDVIYLDFAKAFDTVSTQKVTI
uniref:Reverse transcriptase domain-containing protein n=1 Tax=Leptobrachium leishanense TaxID=445787 RepID=A0A8C5LNF3_9ANUR